MKTRVSLFVFGLLLSLAACSRAASIPSAMPPEPTAAKLILPSPTAVPTVVATRAPVVTALPPVSLTPSATPPTALAEPLRWFVMLDATTGWGAGDASVLRSSDGGRSWHPVTPAGLDLSNAGVPQVYAGDALSAWLLVPDGLDFRTGTLYRTHDGGQAWQSGPVPFGGGAVQVLNPEWAFVMADRGVAAGSHAVDIYTSADGGNSWTVRCAIDPQQAGERCLPFGGNKNGLTFRDPTHGWLGGFIPVNGVTYLFATLDGGKTWQQQQLALPAGFEKAQMEVSPPRFFGEKNGVLVVRAYLPQDVGSTAAEIFYRTRDGGQTWQAAPALRVVGQVALASANEWLVWDGGTLHGSQDAGQNWQALQPNVDLTEKIAALQFIDPNTGWALSMEGESTRLYRTTDGGRTWQ